MTDPPRDDADCPDPSGSIVAVCLASGDLATLDSWIKAQTMPRTRAEAIQLLVRQALSGFNPNTTTIRGEFD